MKTGSVSSCCCCCCLLYSYHFVQYVEYLLHKPLSASCRNRLFCDWLLFVSLLDFKLFEGQDFCLFRLSWAPSLRHKAWNILGASWMLAEWMNKYKKKIRSQTRARPTMKRSVYSVFINWFPRYIYWMPMKWHLDSYDRFGKLGMNQS